MKTVIFDVGRVIVRWEPERLVHDIVGDAAEAERLSRDVINGTWFGWTDAGMAWEESVAKRTAEFPADATTIQTFVDRWDEAVPGLIPGTEAIIEELHAAGTPLYALTNFASDTFQRTKGRFSVFSRFRDIVVSGDEGTIKPDEAIYRMCLARANAKAEDCVFIDDTLVNIEAANRLGIHGLHFVDAEKLRLDLRSLGFSV